MASGRRVNDLTGQRFGHLTVERFTETKKYGSGTYAHWLCRCDCGNEVEVPSCSLSNGNKTNCGCRRYERKNPVPKRELKPYGTLCRYNDGVECRDWSRCDKCGWNPIVERARANKIMEDEQ